MWTSNPDGLEAKLRTAFRCTQKHERPVDVSVTRDLGFLGYKHKIIKLPELLRHARRQLPELLLVLDRTDPLDCLFLARLRLSAQAGGLAIRPIRKRKFE